MPKDTFRHLAADKQARVLEVLKREFASKPFHDVHVQTIVQELGIARGSFYQYFENLEDSYFTILDLETVDIHRLFMEIWATLAPDLIQTLTRYGEEVASLLFQPDSYAIYKHRYLYWNEDLNKRWSRRHSDNYALFRTARHTIDPEKVQFIKAVVHGLIQRCFRESWTKESLLQHYADHIQWITKGVLHGTV